MRKQVISTARASTAAPPTPIRADLVRGRRGPARPRLGGIFTRGETQAFVTFALGTGVDAQRIEMPYGEETGRWMLTYNFPPFCTGEARPLRAPSAARSATAPSPAAPSRPSCPSRRVPLRAPSTSEVLESNGSSSMATVCGSTLALMDAGVPIKAPVAGIAMGLIKEGDEFAVLSDILGDEDHLGDMDFKVTGTTKGITAFQMDIKIAGISREIMSKSRSSRPAPAVHILGEMGKTIAAPRAELSPYAPRITTIHIKPDKIRDIIGPGGKVIRSHPGRPATSRSRSTTPAGSTSPRPTRRTPTRPSR
jgi:polyribonucleotide nucleotidyltransferase